MGLTKTEQYTEEELKIAQIFKVLGHPARISILRSIASSNACICGDLVTEVGLAQATVSQHLKELKSAGLIRGTVEGTSMCYCLDREQWDLLNQYLNAFNITNCGDSCC